MLKSKHGVYSNIGIRKITFGVLNIYYLKQQLLANAKNMETKPKQMIQVQPILKNVYKWQDGLNINKINTIFITQPEGNLDLRMIYAMVCNVMVSYLNITCLHDLSIQDVFNHNSPKSPFVSVSNVLFYTMLPLPYSDITCCFPLFHLHLNISCHILKALFSHMS